VTRVGQSRLIVWDAFLRGSYERQRARSCIIVYEILNEFKERDQTTNNHAVAIRNPSFCV
jgi:hypothetical protein